MVPVPEVVFHDLECGVESGDLELWRELAGATTGMVLELGCGTGRVGIRLARKDSEVIGIERSPALASAFNERAQREDLTAQAIVADAGRTHLRHLFGLVIAPMQMIQQAGGPAARREVLAAIAEHLAEGGRAALAIVADEALAATGDLAAGDGLLPDIREIHGWVFSSRPVNVRPTGRGTVVERLRQSVDPRGGITEETHTDTIDSLTPDQLEEEARVAGLAPLARRELPPAPGYAPSAVVILGKR